MQQRAFDQILADPALQRIGSDLRQLVQPALRLVARVKQSKLQPGSSRLGGAPDLPAGVTWPTFHDQPLAFLGQLRLTDLAGTAVADALPTTGTLWFFYDAQQHTYGADPADRGGWQVVYHGDAPLAPVAFPAGLPTVAQYKPVAITFRPEVTLPSRETLTALGSTWQAAELDRYEELLAKAETPAALRQPHHRLLGHPDQIQDEMQTQVALVTQGITDSADQRAPAALQHAADWRLLLQLDSDDHIAMHWGSAGKLYFWIERQALHDARFDASWCILQSD